MKFNVVCAFLALSLIIAISLGSSSGAGAVQGVDRTGSPLGSGSCASCHNSGSFDPSINLSVLDDGVAVGEYQPGKTYQLDVQISVPNGTPNAYGFQAVALSGAENEGAGSFGNLPQGIQITTLNERDYVEQSQRSSQNSFKVDWTAPSADVGEIRFYVGANAANGTGTSGGDNGVILDPPLTLGFSTISTTQSSNSVLAQLQVFGNPIQDQLRIQLKGGKAGAYQLELFDYNGKFLQSRALTHNGILLSTELKTSRLMSGFYVLRVSNGVQSLTKRIVKQ